MIHSLFCWPISYELPPWVLALNLCPEFVITFGSSVSKVIGLYTAQQSYSVTGLLEFVLFLCMAILFEFLFFCLICPCIFAAQVVNQGTDSLWILIGSLCDPLNVPLSHDRTSLSLFVANAINSYSFAHFYLASLRNFSCHNVL